MFCWCSLEVFFHNPSSHNALFIKAIRQVPTSPIQAVLIALQMAMEAVAFIHCTEVAFLTDNFQLADAIQKGDFLQDPRHWSLFWQTWSQMQPFFQTNTDEVHWISRKYNAIADELSGEARNLQVDEVQADCSNITYLAYPNIRRHAAALKSNFRGP